MQSARECNLRESDLRGPTVHILNSLSPITPTEIQMALQLKEQILRRLTNRRHQPITWLMTDRRQKFTRIRHFPCQRPVLPLCHVNEVKKRLRHEHPNRRSKRRYMQQQKHLMCPRRHRLNGRGTHEGNESSQLLSKAEETMLAKRCTEFTKNGFPPRKTMIIEMAAGIQQRRVRQINDEEGMAPLEKTGYVDI
jgi:hypothetical protein